MSPTPTGLRALRLLSQAAPLSNDELAAALGVSKQWSSELVSRLAAEGLVQREPAVTRIRLTRKGRRLVSHEE